MIKKLMGVAVLSGVLGGTVMAMSSDRHLEQVDETKVQAVIDARLHELLVKLNAQHALR
jgi:hypothetical protein